MQHLCEYSSKSLIHLSLGPVFGQTPILDHIKMPFTSVKILRITGCGIRNFSMINSLFPNIQSLELGRIKYWCDNIYHLPTVKHLSILDSHDTEHITSKLKPEEVEQLMKLNPQLVKLELTNPHSTGKTVFPVLLRYLPNLKHLKVECLKSQVFDMSMQCTNQIEYLSLVNTSLCCSFTNLKYLEGCDAVVSKYINTNVNLKILKIVNCNHDLAKYFENEFVLRNIEDLCIEVLNVKYNRGIKYFNISPGALWNFLKNNHSLKKISITAIRSRYSDKLSVFEDFVNELIINGTKLKIRKNVVEFVIERNSDRLAKKYVIRNVRREFNCRCTNNLIDVKLMLELTTYEESRFIYGYNGRVEDFLS